VCKVHLLPVEDDRSRIPLMDAADDIDECGLARSVLADEAMHFSSANFEIDGIEDLVAEKTL
jgi:hypothetical protein